MRVTRGTQTAAFVRRKVFFLNWFRAAESLGGNEERDGGEKKLTACLFPSPVVSVLAAKLTAPTIKVIKSSCLAFSDPRCHVNIIN